jgi:hypothetical protein
MNKHAYPDGFFTKWTEDERNSYFAEQAKRRRIRFELTPFAEFKLEERAPYLVKGLLPRSGLAVVWGPPKCGKSFWVFDLLIHVAFGWEYRGHRVVSGPSSTARSKALKASGNESKHFARASSPKASTRPRRFT